MLGDKIMRNIALIGMPGAGKSTVGVVLAKTLGMVFIDSDLIIQEREKRLLQEIINNDGIESFLEKEAAAVLSIREENSVIATGGSVIYKKQAIEYLKGNSKIVYLKLSYEEILQRINNIKTRGIALKENQNLKDLYNERKLFYEKYADITLECDNKTVEEVIELMIGNIRLGRI